MAGVPPLSEETLLRAVEALKTAGGNQSEAARSLDNMPVSTFKNWIQKAAKRGLMGFAPVLEGFEIAKVSSTLDAEGNVTSQHVQQKPERELSKYNLMDGHAVSKVSAYLDANGNVTAQWVQSKPGELPIKLTTDAIKEAFAEWTPPPFVNPDHGPTDENRLTVYPIADLHLALKASADEAGADYDLNTAAERFRTTTGRLFDCSPNSDTALILQLGDWTHADDELALTPTSKHNLQVSDRQLPTIKTGVKIMKDYVYHALRKHRRVIIKVLRGNHDLNAWITLYVALDEHFRDNPRVTVDGGAADYWFFRFGATLIGAHHGHRLKPADMAGAMATECREDWGETLYRLFLHGHLHHMIVQEVLGVRVECFRTIAEVDAHHAGKYGSGKSLVSITIHKEHGEDGRAQINLPPVMKRAARAL